MSKRFALAALLVLAVAAAVAVPTQGHVRSRFCGSLRVHYRDHRTRQAVVAHKIRTRGLHCGYARHVAHNWAEHSRLSYKPAHHAAGARCRYQRLGSDIGYTYCRTGRHHKLNFEAYDSSPFH